MKIYYNLAPTGSAIMDQIRLLIIEKYKYHLMWALRKYEQQMIDEGGIIIMNYDDEGFKFEPKNFSEWMTRTIWDVFIKSEIHKSIMASTEP